MPKNKYSLTSALTSAAIFGAVGLVVLAESLYADGTHSLIPVGRFGAPSMTPHQGYIVVLFLAVAAYALFLAFRAQNRDSE